MKKTVIVCDRCDRRIEDGTAWAVTLKPSIGHGSRSAARSFDWCRACVAETTGMAYSPPQERIEAAVAALV